MTEEGQPMEEALVVQLFGMHSTKTGNNYVRPDGQNVGNFLGDRPSSRVLAAPGGASNFSLSHESGAKAPPAPPVSAPEPVQESLPPAQAALTSPAPAKPAKLSFLDKMTAKIAGSPGVMATNVAVRSQHFITPQLLSCIILPPAAACAGV
jgi:hypothetical protein